MVTQDFKRRLTAIFSADVEGYSRLMREDEEATVRTITSYRAAMAKLIQQYRGRVVDSPGDNILAEFTSVVDAVNRAVEIQRELAERNAELPSERKMEFRIGINLGDVIEEGERIYGDGVNIAARVEGLAEGGGICISGTVYDAIEAKLGLERVSGGASCQEHSEACAGISGSIFSGRCRPQSCESEKGCGEEMAQYGSGHSGHSHCGSGCSHLAVLLPRSFHGGCLGRKNGVPITR